MFDFLPNWVLLWVAPIVMFASAAVAFIDFVATRTENTWDNKLAKALLWVKSNVLDWLALNVKPKA